jgi:hypothetical protein
MKLLGRSGVLAWTFYLWSVLWVSLFPILNVSSGELKPRGLFVDENAYMSGMLSGRAAPPVRSTRINVSNSTNLVISADQLVSVFADTLGVPCVIQRDIQTTTCLIMNRSRPKNIEASVVVFPLTLGSSSSALALKMALQLATVLKDVRWSSRNFLFLFVPEVNTFSSHVEAWLTGSGESALGAAGLQAGLIRDSIILHIHESSRRQLRLLVIGLDGLLPNMVFLKRRCTLYIYSCLRLTALKSFGRRNRISWLCRC